METHTHREDSHVRMEVESGAMLPQAQGRLGTPGAGKGKEYSSPRTLEGARPLIFFLFLATQHVGF